MRLGSLCSGAGGLDMAVEQVFGAETVWHCEIDDAASKVLAARWPGVPNHRDLINTDWGQVEPVDILCGGYPCQPFSSAGKRRGVADERHLWPYFLTAIRHLRPRFVILENVAGHRTMGFDRVLGDLAETRFDAEWCSLRASDVGAPHGRERIFALAYPQHGTGYGEWSRPQPWQGNQVASDADSARRRDAQQDSEASTRGQVSHRGDARGRVDVDWGKYRDAVTRWESLTRPSPPPKTRTGSLNPAFSEWLMGWPAGWVTSVPGLSRNDQLRIIGNGVVPQCAAAALTWLLQLEVAA